MEVRSRHTQIRTVGVAESVAVAGAKRPRETTFTEVVALPLSDQLHVHTQRSHEIFKAVPTRGQGRSLL